MLCWMLLRGDISEREKSNDSSLHSFVFQLKNFLVPCLICRGITPLSLSFCF